MGSRENIWENMRAVSMWVGVPGEPSEDSEKFQPRKNVPN